MIEHGQHWHQPEKEWLDAAQPLHESLLDPDRGVNEAMAIAYDLHAASQLDDDMILAIADFGIEFAHHEDKSLQAKAPELLSFAAEQILANWGEDSEDGSKRQALYGIAVHSLADIVLTQAEIGELEEAEMTVLEAAPMLALYQPDAEDFAFTGDQAEKYLGIEELALDQKRFALLERMPLKNHWTSVLVESIKDEEINVQAVANVANREKAYQATAHVHDGEVKEAFRLARSLPDDLGLIFAVGLINYADDLWSSQDHQEQSSAQALLEQLLDREHGLPELFGGSQGGANGLVLLESTPLMELVVSFHEDALGQRLAPLINRAYVHARTFSLNPSGAVKQAHRAGVLMERDHVFTRHLHPELREVYVRANGGTAVVR